MNRRRMMMQNRVVNLFDKNNADITFKARLLSNGVILFGGDVQANKSFVSYFVSVEYGKSYTLIRKPIDTSNSAYNRWVFYNKSKSCIGNGSSIVEVNTITIPENCYYIKFIGLIDDIDNVKFYKA